MSETFGTMYTKHHHKSHSSVGLIAEATRLLDWRVTTRPTISNLKLVMTLGIVNAIHFQEVCQADAIRKYHPRKTSFSL